MDEINHYGRHFCSRATWAGFTVPASIGHFHKVHFHELLCLTSGNVVVAGIEGGLSGGLLGLVLSSRLSKWLVVFFSWQAVLCLGLLGDMTRHVT